MCVDIDWKMFIPLPILFENKFIKEIPNPNYTYIKNNQKSSKTDQIAKEL